MTCETARMRKVGLLEMGESSLTVLRRMARIPR
jgi:hypothetical protein